LIGNGKKYIQIFQPTKECRLSWSELVVYSYLAYQDVYGDFPSAMRIVRATGLARNTVKAAVTHLGELGLIQDQQVQKPFPGWFATAKRKAASHWRDSLAYWRLLVRDPSSELTPIQAGLICFLWHCSRTSYVPRKGWSIRLLSILFRAKWATIKSALVVLQKNDLLRFQPRGKEGISITHILTPTLSDLDHFQNTVEQEEREEHQIIETDDLPDIFKCGTDYSWDGPTFRPFEHQDLSDEERFTRELHRKLGGDGEQQAQAVIESALWQERKDECLQAAKEDTGGMILHRLAILRRELASQQEVLTY
jgi:hypothetical protein